jgi:hypothetical protein
MTTDAFISRDKNGQCCRSVACLACLHGRRNCRHVLLLRNALISYKALHTVMLTVVYVYWTYTTISMKVPAVTWQLIRSTEVIVGARNFQFFFHFYCLASEVCLHSHPVLFLFYIPLPYAVGMRTDRRCVWAPTRGYFSSLSAQKSGRVSQLPCFGFRFTALSHICPGVVAFNTITSCLTFTHRPLWWTSLCSDRSFSHCGLLQVRCSCLHVL